MPKYKVEFIFQTDEEFGIAEIIEDVYNQQGDLFPILLENIKVEKL